MDKSFREKWLETVDRKNSVLCAGIDPVECGLPAKPNLLPQTDKREWATRYVEAVAPYCAAIKPNLHFWKDGGGIETLQILARIAHANGLAVILDEKMADIGSTDEAGLSHDAKNGMDAVTVAPFAGNLEQIADYGRKAGVGIISMCLMSNPEYAREKSKLVSIKDKHERKTDGGFLYGSEDITEDIINLGLGEVYVPQYLQLAHDAAEFGVEGIVIGAPSEKNHITEDQIKKVRGHVGDQMLVLCPGYGAQGGDPGVLWRYFGKDRVIVNVGRDLMFPRGIESTHEEQAAKAKYLQEELNKLRNKE